MIIRVIQSEPKILRLVVIEFKIYICRTVPTKQRHDFEQFTKHFLCVNIDLLMTNYKVQLGVIPYLRLNSMENKLFQKTCGSLKITHSAKVGFLLSAYCQKSLWLKLWSLKSQNQFMYYHQINFPSSQTHFWLCLRWPHHGGCADHQWRWGSGLWPLSRGQRLLPIGWSGILQRGRD